MSGLQSANLARGFTVSNKIGLGAVTLSAVAAMASVALAVLLLVAKGWAAAETQSTAMLGSLADTAAVVRALELPVTEP